MLSSHQPGKLCEELKQNIYTDSQTVALWIKRSFDADYTSQGVADLLKRTSFRYKKKQEVPCERHTEKQREFMEELSKVFSNKDDTEVIYYADGVHPAHNSRSTQALTEKGKELE
jgi:hypothetical protein